MEEEEEIWFNEDDDYEDNESEIQSSTDILKKKIDTDLDNIGKIIDKKPEANGATTKMNNNASTQKPTVMNNNPNANTTTVQPATSPSGNESRSSLFKRVSIFCCNCKLVYSDRVLMIFVKKISPPQY